jgi:hypothetical protein
MAIFKSYQINNETNKYFCLSGQEDFLDEDGNPRIENEDSDIVVAKTIFSKKPKHFADSDRSYARYYIKLDPNSKIFNPKKILSSIENKDPLSFIKNICKEGWSFKEVTPQTFQKYLMFLKTKQISWLKEAQRDLQ